MYPFSDRRTKEHISIKRNILVLIFCLFVLLSEDFACDKNNSPHDRWLIKGLSLHLSKDKNEGICRTRILICNGFWMRRKACILWH